MSLFRCTCAVHFSAYTLHPSWVATINGDLHSDLTAYMPDVFCATTLIYLGLGLALNADAKTS